MTEKCWCIGNPTVSHRRGTDGCKYATGAVMDLDPAAVQAAIAAAKTAAWAQCTHEDVGDCWNECNDIVAAVHAAIQVITAQVARATADAIADRLERIVDGFSENDRIGDTYQHAAIIARSHIPDTCVVASPGGHEGVQAQTSQVVAEAPNQP